jgi:hypothetical protein
MKNFGYANGWGNRTPKEVKECDAKGHKKEYPKSYERCVTIIRCTECGYQYKIDSSG